ncbi:CHAD domain-containing protein [Phytoactinopolyspora halotolerans]|uniref:CHAD domain-containing protein n=1 Tax=Phytoactinopolyspora halotolerans TaxID=1981512 RepID=A0A6L9S4D6_9ACTN|nr:CHAD domain-containing protein [Phytoactinopolyspora halotolerans]NED99995.1 CHAD domain-containing protein [Phytoactinopolyspora halotolerans]
MTTPIAPAQSPEGDVPVRRITPGMTADVAVATALLGFLDTIEHNVPGTIEDRDPEFLHDLRVAVRRTRSLIKLAGDVLPAPLAERYAPRFKWLGDLTTPTRDLDVYLLRLNDLAEWLVGAEGDDLDPFAEHVRRQRSKSRRSLVRGLRSQRFSSLCRNWRTALTAVVDGRAGMDASADPAGQRSRSAPVTVEHLAADRVRHAYKRVLRRAQVITPDSPAEQIHALRKRCKELRYILEVFEPVCAPGKHRSVVKRLKRVQDVLGDFQDGEVQSAALRSFAQQMLDDDPPPAATLLAMGELSARFTAQQHQARLSLTAALPRLVGANTHSRIEAMLPARTLA